VNSLPGATRNRNRPASSWTTDATTAKRYGYPLHRPSQLELLADRVDDLEAAIAALYGEIESVKLETSTDYREVVSR
jgi:hypothetical protein